MHYRILLILSLFGICLADSYNVSSDKLGNISLKVDSKGLKTLHIKSSADLSSLYSGTYSFNNKPVVVKPRSYLAGTVRIGKNITPAAIIVDRNKYLIDIGKINGSRFYRQLVLENGKVSIKKSFKSEASTCGNSHLLKEEPVVTSNANINTSAVNVKVVKLSVDGDANWNQTYGTAGLDKIAEIVHSANVIYIDQFKVKINLVRTNVYTSNYFNGSGDANDASARLDTFTEFIDAQNRYSNVADAFHLFTTRDFTGSTAGIAYIGQVCRYYPYGLVQDYPGLSSTIFAHELGHNFNAPHDSGSQCGSDATIMQPSLGYPVPTTFSSCSKSIVASYINTYGSCLTDEVLGATPTPAPPGGENPTPIPTTPTPTPTPTPSGGGNGSNPGGGDSSDEPDATITFKQAVDKITLSVDGVNTAANACSYKIFIRELKASKYKVLNILSGASLINLKLSGILPARYKASKVDYKLGIGLALKCGSYSYTSSIFKFDTKKSKSKSTLSFAPWITKFKKTMIKN